MLESENELSFAEMVSEIAHGDLPEVPKTTDTPVADPAAAPSPESPAAKDTPPEDPKEATPPADAPAVEPKPTDPAPEAAKPAVPAPVVPDPKEIIEVGDFKGTRAELVAELERRGLRQADYTRKRQEDSAARSAAEAEVAEVRQLTKDISQDRSLQKFLAAHPEALETLLADPKATRKNLLGQPDKVDEFWSDYEVIQSNPRIAAKLAGEHAAEPEEVTAEIQEQRAANAIVTIAGKLKDAVKEVGKKFEGVDPEDVEKYLLELGGADPSKPMDSIEAGRSVFGRLYQMFFVEQGENLFIDTRLIHDRFEQLKDRKTPAAPSAVDEHNKKVDEALKAEPVAATPKGGAPAPAAPKPKQISNLRDALDDILQPTG